MYDERFFLSDLRDIFLGDHSLSAGFSAWSGSFDNGSLPAEIREGLEQLSKHSILESQNFNQKLECAAAALDEIATIIPE